MRRASRLVRGRPCGKAVGQRSCHSVRGVGWSRSGSQPEQPGHHELHLFLRRRACADHGFLDLGWRELVHEETGARSGEEHDSARMPENDCCPDVSGVKHVFNRQHVWMVSLDQVNDAIVDVSQTLGEWVTRPRTNDAALDEHGLAWTCHASYHAVPSGRRAGVEAQDRHARAMSATSMSKFASTFCTSSSSSSSSRSLTSDSAVFPSTRTVVFGIHATSLSTT